MKKEKTEKTNVARLLDKAGISYTLVPYQVDEEDLSAGHIALQLMEPLEQVFKTLVLCGDRSGHFVCVVPGGDEVDLKKAAKVSGNKKCDLIPMKELLPLTGYVRGGCSPVGMKKPFPVFFDVSARNFDYIYVSAGVRGLQLKINPLDLASYVRAQFADLVKMKTSDL